MMKVYEQIASLVTAIENCEKTNNLQWLRNHSDKLEDITEKYLPSGSGIDSGCTIDIDNSNESKIVILCPYHCMDEHGFYCGWRDYKIVLRPCFIGGIDLKVYGRDYNGLKDYLGDTFHYALTREVE